MSQIRTTTLAREHRRARGAGGRWLRLGWLYALVLLLLALGCTSEDPPALGGESNWLRACESQSDCGEGTCTCGVCTRECQKDAECGAKGNGVCVAVEHAAVPQGCAPAKAAGLCLEACAESECSEGTSCADEACGSTKLLSLNAQRDSGSESDSGMTDASIGLDASMDESDMTDAQSLSTLDATPAETAPTNPRFQAGPGKVCGFEYVGEWVTCSEEPEVEFIFDAQTTADCLSECERRPNCTAVTDYFWHSSPSCNLVLSDCDEPMQYPDSLGFDGRVYRVTCDDAPSDTVKTTEELSALLPDTGYRVTPDSPCRFETLERATACEGYGIPDYEATVASSLQTCMQECDSNDDCTGVFEFLLRDGSYECVVYTGPCDEPRAAIEVGDQFVKVCDG